MGWRERNNAAYPLDAITTSPDSRSALWGETVNIRFVIYGCILGLVLLTGAYYKGVWDEHEKYEAAAKSVRAQDVAIAKAMQPQLQAALTASHTYTTTIIPQVPHVTEFYIPSPDAVSIPRPAYYLTAGAVRLWNAALSASTAGSPVAAVTSADLALSPVSFDEAETNAILNFGQYRDCRTIVKGWQDWFNSVSKVKP